MAQLTNKEQRLKDSVVARKEAQKEVNAAEKVLDRATKKLEKASAKVKKLTPQE